MFYGRFKNDDMIISLFDGYDDTMHRKMKTCIYTDGKVEHSLKKDRLIDHRPNECLIIGSTTVDETMDKVIYYTERKVKIIKANYIIIANYIYSLEEKIWILNNPRISLNHNLNVLDEMKFILFQDSDLPTSSEEEPESIVINGLNDKFKSRKLIKKSN